MLADGLCRCTQSLQGKAGTEPPLDHGPVPHFILPFDVIPRGVKTVIEGMGCSSKWQISKRFYVMEWLSRGFLSLFTQSFKHPIHR